MTLELSTSQLGGATAEVRTTISVGAESWLGSVVVEEASGPRIDPGTERGDETEEDLDRLGVGSKLGDVHMVDPDLAVLLSPNKIAGGNGIRSGSTEQSQPSTYRKGDGGRK